MANIKIESLTYIKTVPEQEAKEVKPCPKPTSSETLSPPVFTGDPSNKEVYIEVRPSM